jgi:hypothetical protein
MSVKRNCKVISFKRDNIKMAGLSQEFSVNRQKNNGL